MGCIITFIDGTTKEISDASYEESELNGEYDFLVKDEESEIIVEVNYQQIKMIEWQRV